MTIWFTFQFLLKTHALTTATKRQHKMQVTALINTTLVQCLVVVQLSAGKQESLLLWWDALLDFHNLFQIVHFLVEVDVHGNAASGQTSDLNLCHCRCLCLVLFLLLSTRKALKQDTITNCAIS